MKGRYLTVTVKSHIAQYIKESIGSSIVKPERDSTLLASIKPHLLLGSAVEEVTETPEGYEEIQIELPDLRQVYETRSGKVYYCDTMFRDHIDNRGLERVRNFFNRTFKAAFRTFMDGYTEFQNENNLAGVIGTEMVNHWYLVLLFIILVYAMWKLYRSPGKAVPVGKWWVWYPSQVLLLAACAPFVVAGIRGGFTTAVRPITISNANQYVDRPIEAALVLNTPFSIYRTIGKDVFVVPNYFSDEKTLASIYTPIHTPNDSLAGANSSLFTLHSSLKKNVVVLIVESFGREYIGALNETLENGQYKGYTPHVDSLVSHSTTFRYSFCNGRKSIDGMPSILSSIPMFVEPFFLTPASMNQVSGIASLLAGEGYETAFFHGAQRGSMGFMAFARSTGFQQYYGREDYNDDPRFGGDDDFDGMWAIWDEPFLQYYATKMSEMKEPFMTAVFTASSHHPYHVPEQYKDVYPEEGIEIHKCIRYTDMAIGKFFEKASHEPWFKNTIFVLTSDHTNLSDHPFYQTDIGGFCSPIIIYDPSQPVGEMQDKIAQQIDILPTVMGMLHYQKPYFGRHLPVCEAWTRAAVRRPADQGHVCPGRLADAAQPGGEGASATTDGTRTEGHHPTVYGTYDTRQTKGE